MAKQFISVTQITGGQRKPLALAIDEIVSISKNSTNETVIHVGGVGDIIVAETPAALSRKITGRAA